MSEPTSTPRAAAEIYLSDREVEAAAVFKRPVVRGAGLGDGFTPQDIRRGLESIYERLRMGRVGRLQGTFLLAVTADQVFAFKFMERFGNFEVRKEIAVFDRNEIRIGRDDSENSYLEATENGRTRQISLDRKSLTENPAADEVSAALAE
jgi:hypothetical protein